MILTERLLLRPWCDKDRPAFAAMNADPEVVGAFPGVMARSESNDLMDFFIACWREDGFSYAAIEDRATGEFLGMSGLACARFDAPICPCFEIGWALAYPHWHHGYATEAARGWLDFGFGRLALPEILAFTDTRNLRSLAVMRRLGMRHDTQRDFHLPELPRGHVLGPQMLYALTRAEWQARETAQADPA